MELSPILFIITLISATSGNVNVVYLRGIPRLNNLTYWDYYFSCNTEGLTLQWQVNENPLVGFSTGDVARIFSNTRSNFNYTTNLLSSQPTTGGQFTFDSVIIVSLLGRSSLNVTCRNGPSSNSTNNAESRMDVESETIDSVSLELLLTRPLVSAVNYNTSIFVCGVDNQFMRWETNTNIFTLRRSDRIGQNQQNLQQNDTFVRQQAILIGHEPYQIVSVLFVTDTSNVAVVCGHNTNNLQLPRENMATTQSSTATGPEPTTSNTPGTSTGGGTETTTSNSSTSLYIVIGVVITVLLVMCAVMVIVIYAYRVVRLVNKSTPLRRVSDLSNLIDGKHPSYHGVLSRDEAEVKLDCKSGHCYLVRYSEKRRIYVLSIRDTEASIVHITIVVRVNKLWLFFREEEKKERKIFESLDDLLNHYKADIGEACRRV